MAHIPDGVLSVPVLIGGAALAVGGLALGLSRLEERDIPKTAILSAVFFVASLVAVPIGPTSVHLLLAGAMGIVLGVAAIPAVFVGLLLQAVLFGFGGITSLGVDVVDIAFPGVILAALARPMLRRVGGRRDRGPGVRDPGREQPARRRRGRGRRQADARGAAG